MAVGVTARSHSGKWQEFFWENSRSYLRPSSWCYYDEPELLQENGYRPRCVKTSHIPYIYHIRSVCDRYMFADYSTRQRHPPFPRTPAALGCGLTSNHTASPSATQNYHQSRSIHRLHAITGVRSWPPRTKM